MNQEINYELKALTQNITNLRQKNKLTKKEMAKLLGISIYSLNKIEEDILPHKITIDILIKINSNFGISPHEIMQNQNYQDKA